MKAVQVLIVLAVGLSGGFLLGRSTGAHSYQLLAEHGVILRLNTRTGQTCVAAPGDWSASDEAARLVQRLPACK